MTTAAPEMSGPGPVLHVVGAVVVGFWLVTQVSVTDVSSAVVVGVSLLSLVAWVARVFVRTTRQRDVATVVMLLAGAAMVQPTDALLVTPPIVAVSLALSDRRHPIAFGAGLTVVGTLVIVIAAAVADRPVSYLLGVLAGMALGVVVGLGRRQARMAAERERQLLARDVEIERELERNALLKDRATIARDMHDVLAHSLGGLVVQLDAVEALLEIGRVDEAAQRVGAARTLAAEGLGEARRAVAALRDPGREGPATALDDPAAFDRLLTAHESLGGRVTVTGREAGRAAYPALDHAHRRALAAVSREALSNARRHAPGETVRLAFSSASDGLLRIRIANDVASGVGGDDRGGPGPAQPVGGGQGLIGMRERFAELHDASRITAGVVGAEFVVDAVVVTAQATAAVDDGGAS